MAEEGIRDFIGIINITITGLEDAGKIALTVTSGTVKVAEKIAQLLAWIVQSIKDAPYSKTGGITNNHVLQVKFSDLNYSNMSLFYAKDLYTKLNEEHPGTYNQEKINRLLSPDTLKKEFERLAKKNGLLYSKVPNFIADRESGVIEYRFAYSKSQENAMFETKAQMQALIYKQLKQCNVPDKIAKKYSEKMTKKEEAGKSLTENVNDFGIGKVTDEAFKMAMYDTYPDYDPKRYAPEKPNSDLFRNTRENVNIQEITFSKILKHEPNSIKVVLDEYPNVAMTIKTSEILNRSQTAASQGTIHHKFSLRGDVKYDFEVYLVNPLTKKLDLQNPKHYSMTLLEFELLMKQNAEKNRDKMERQQLSLPSQDNSLSMSIQKTNRK